MSLHKGQRKLNDSKVRTIRKILQRVVSPQKNNASVGDGSLLGAERERKDPGCH